MKKYDVYDKAEAFTGDYETLKPGGYICKILGVKVEEKQYGHLMTIQFDIVEGERKDFYKRQFERKRLESSEAKWPGMYYQTIKDDDNIKHFKGFMANVESSNSPYKWDWKEEGLKGKLFGGVFGQEEYIKRDGSIGISTKCRFIKTVEQIRNCVDIPEIKRLGGYASSGSEINAPPPDDDDLPF